MSLHIYLFFDDPIYGKFAWKEFLRDWDGLMGTHIKYLEVVTKKP